MGGLKRNQFYMKTQRPGDFDGGFTPNSTFDSGLSAVFSDIFPGKLEQVDITGGQDAQYYITECKIPDVPPFGDANLVGFKHYFYVPDGGLTLDPENTFNPASFKVWKVNRSMGPSEGNMIPDITSGDTTDKSLVVIGSTRNSENFVSWGDNFDAGRGTVATQLGTWAASSNPYVIINQALSDAEIGLLHEQTDTLQKYRERFGTHHPELGWIIYVTPKGGPWWTIGIPFVETPYEYSEDKQWEPIRQDEGALTPRPQWEDHALRQKNLLKFNVPTGLDTEEHAFSVTPSDSIFCDVHSKIGGDTGTGTEIDDRVLADATYSTEKSLTGGGSMKMRCIWAAGAATVNRYHNEDPGGNGATQRQEVVATVEIPYPNNMGDAPPLGGDTALEASIGAGTELKPKKYGVIPEISTDIFIENLQKTYDISTGDDYTENRTNTNTFARAFIITFSGRKPRASESFFDFLREHTDYSAKVNKRGAGDNEGTMLSGIVFSKNNADNIPDNPPDWSAYISQCDQRLKANGDYSNFAKEGIVGYPFTGIIGIDNSSSDVDNASETNNLYHRGWRIGPVVYQDNEEDADDDGDYTSDDKHIRMVWPHWNLINTTEGSEFSNTNQWARRDLFNLPEQEWINFKFQLDPNDWSGDILMKISDSGGKEFIRKRLDVMNLPNYGFYPRYMTYWLVNFPSKGNDKHKNIAPNYPNDMSTNPEHTNSSSSSVYVDNVTFKHFNRKLYNATATKNNATTRQNLPIKAGTVSNWDCTKDQVSSIGDLSYENIINTPSYIAIGFDSLSDFDQAQTDGPGEYGTNLFFNGYSLTNPTDNAQLGMVSPDKYVYLGYTSSVGIASGTVEAATADLTAEEGLGNGNHGFSDHYGNAWYGDIFHPSSGSKGSSGRGLDVVEADGDNEAQSGVHLTKDPFGVDNFSQQGIANIQFKSDIAGLTDHIPHKRECIWASARIMRLVSVNSFVVDDTTIFNLADDTKYIIYEKGTSSNYNIFTLRKRPEEDGLITVNEEIRAGKDTLLPAGGADPTTWLCKQDGLFGYSSAIHGAHNIARLFISPLKYWMIFQFYPYDSSGNPTSDRFYSSICTVNKNSTDLTANPYIDQLYVTDIGTSYNERIFTDGPPVNTWNLAPGLESDIEVETDYGFGKWDEETFVGGYANKFYANKEDIWTSVDMSNVIEKDNLQPEDTLTLLYGPHSTISKSKIQVETLQSENLSSDSGLTKGDVFKPLRPYSLAIYEDSVPVISDFTIEPSSENPLFPTFTWKLEDDDAWYGFIILDDESILHQYHKAGFHAPCNTPITSTENPNVNFGLSGKSDRSDWFNYNDNLAGNFVNMALGQMDGSCVVADNNLFLQPDGIAGWAYDFGRHDEAEGYADFLMVNDQQTLVDNNGDDVNTQMVRMPSSNLSFVVHITPASARRIDGRSESKLKEELGTIFSIDVRVPTYDGDGVYTGGALAPSPFNVSLDRTSSHIVVKALGVGAAEECILTSKTKLPLDDITPTCVIVTLDTTLTSGNLKLFINGRIEDISGKATTNGGGNNWKKNAELAVADNSNQIRNQVEWRDKVTNKLTIGGKYTGPDVEGLWSQPYVGKIEDLVLYPITIYPIDPAVGRATIDKAMSEAYIDLGNDFKTPLDYLNEGFPMSNKKIGARLFVKDYHNIRGLSHRDIGTSNQVFIKKVTPVLDGRAD